MDQHSQNTASQQNPIVSGAIKKGTDDLLAFLEQERSAAMQVSEHRYSELNRSFEDYKNWMNTYQSNTYAKLQESEKQMNELNLLNTELRRINKENEKRIRDMAIQLTALNKNYESMQSELLAWKNCQKLTSATSTQVVSDLAQFGISYLGPNFLSFNEQWVKLLGQCASLESSSGNNNELPELTTQHRLSPDGVRFLLEALSDRLQSVAHQNNLSPHNHHVLSEDQSNPHVAAQRTHIQRPPYHLSQHPRHGMRIQDIYILEQNNITN